MEERKISTGKTGPLRKRSAAMHKKQQLTDFWNSDNILPHRIDSDLFMEAKPHDFYEDAGENYEKVEEFVSFSNLPHNIKEKFEEDFKKTDEKLIERKKRDNFPIKDRFSIEKDSSVPLRVDSKHRHDCIRFPPKEWEKLSKQNDENEYGK